MDHAIMHDDNTIESSESRQDHLTGMGLPISSVYAARKKKHHHHLRKRWQILVVWASTLTLCSLVWVVGYNIVELQARHNGATDFELGAIVFTTLAIVSGVALTVGILDRPGKM